jgi:tripartite-type tricarboxylate transporter receptor subunit TctC
MMLVVPNSSPARSLRELINLASASPGKLNYASQGVGSINHLATELFSRLAGVKFTHVPYNAYNQAIPDLIAGEVALLIDGPPVILPHVQAGNLKALAVNSGERLGPLPEVPTFEEAGLPGFWPGPWYGVLVPKGTSSAVIERLRNAFGTALKSADVVRTADEQGQTLIGGSPAEFRTFIQTEQERYGSLIRETGIRLE